MSERKSVIELNGKRYDASSGKVISHPHVNHDESETHAKTVVHPTTGTNMDGFKKPGPKAAPTKTHKTPVHHSRKTQTAKTLMRSAVSKPTSRHTSPIQGVSAHVSSTDSAALATPSSIQQKRSHLANKVSKSPLISRFGADSSKHQVKTRTAHLPVMPAPAAAPPTHKSSHVPHHVSNSVADNHIATAMEKATSHNNHKLAKQKRRHKAAHKLGVSSRFISVGATTLAVVLLAGFFAYQNVPSITVRMAASKAGFSARLPGYKPAGFAVSGPVQASPGVVTINFAANGDDSRTFQLSQRPSEWNSESLLNNYVATLNQPYQTVQEAGKTVYIYDDSAATWVSGGVWYQIEGDSQLSSDQLLKIASSI